jgi:hypothetical protein
LEYPHLAVAGAHGTHASTPFAPSTPSDISRADLKSLPRPVAVSYPIHTYTELQQQIHDDLRIQHPEWVKPNGESPMCDSYETRLTKMLDALTRRETNGSIVPADGALQPAVTGS